VLPDSTTSLAAAGHAAEPVSIEMNPPAEIWDSYVSGHPEATLFHGTGWQRVLERTFGYRPHHSLARRGSSVCGVLPLYSVPTLPFGHALVSTPFAVYGGVCADDAIVAQALLDAAGALARASGARYVELRHERPIGTLPAKDLYFTFRRAIHPEPEVNMAGIPRNQRRSIRIGEKHGLKYRIGGADLLPEFYDVYSKNIRSLGSPVFPRALFDALLEEYGSRCRILAVFHGTNMVSAVMTFFYRDQVMPYYQGATRDGIQLATNDFMYWSLLCYAAQNGYKVFDFGRSKKGTGPYHFKRHWGFPPTPLAYQYQLVRQREMPNLSPANPRFSMAIRAWRRLPLRLTQWLGPKLVRYFP